MNCRDARKQLKSMHDTGRLPEGALAHMGSCRACSRERDIIMKLRHALAAGETVKVPGDFNKKVWEKIGARAPAGAGIFIFRPAFVLGAAAAAALIVVLAVKTGAGPKAAAVIAKAPAAVKTQFALKKSYFNKTAPAVKAAAAEGKNSGAAVQAAAGNRAGAQQAGNEPAGGRLAALNTGNQAQKPYYINRQPVEKNVAAASLNKNPPVLSAPLVIKNNMIRPLSGGRMCIEYSIRDTCDVSIVVYNRAGEPVRTVFKGSRTPGVYEDYWAGDNDTGMVVTDGIYVVYVKTGLTEQRIKAMVVK